MPERSLNLQFPAAGVARRLGHEIPPRQGPYPSPWSVNVRLQDSFNRRLRGGSRDGLTKLLATDLGSDVDDMVSLQVSSANGASEYLVLLVDSTVKIVSGAPLAVTTPVAYLTNESTNNLTDESNNQLVISTQDAPSSGFLVVANQKVYIVTSASIFEVDPKTGKIDHLAATAGTIPTGSSFGAVYRDRLVLPGSDNAIYVSRQGDFTDWDYGAHHEDLGRPLAFQLSAASRVGDIPKAVINIRDANLILGTEDSLWRVSGDPVTGQLVQLSDSIGIVGPNCWCKSDNQIFGLSKDGIFSCALDGSNLRVVSDERIPDDLRDVNTASVDVHLGYDHDKQAIHIYLVTSGGNDTHWLFEFASGAFWPMRLNNNHAPQSVATFDNDLILAGVDGYLRKIGGNDDDGQNVASHLLVGPLKIGGGVNQLGLLTSLHGMLATGSSSVTFRIVTGNTAEEASENGKTAIQTHLAGGDYSSYVHASGTLAAGRSLTKRPRVRSMWVCIWLQSTGRWAFEGLSIGTMPFGRWK